MVQSLSPEAHEAMEDKDIEMASTEFASPYNTTTTTATGMSPVYKVYKRRFLGLFQLVLLNIVISWDVRLTQSLRSICTTY